MKWTLITGSAKGLGAHLAMQIAETGSNVVIQYKKNREKAEEIVKKCRQLGVQAESIYGDFSTTETTDSFVKEYLQRFPNTLNLINNVGQYIMKSAINTSIAEWNSIFQSNLHSPFILIQNLLPSIKQERGSIINIGVAGLVHMKANLSSTAFKLTKSALWGLTRSLALELAPSHVRVNMVSPGFLENAVDLPNNLNDLPMKRAGHFDEVARVILFLLNSENCYITGQNIEVAGGVGL